VNTTPDDEAPDELTNQFRRASTEAGERPAPRTRESILAHAHRLAAAAQAEAELVKGIDTRMRAANDSRWQLKAVAAFAGIGFAALFALQTFRIAPQSAPVAVPVVSNMAPAVAPSPPAISAAPELPAASDKLQLADNQKATAVPAATAIQERSLAVEPATMPSADAAPVPVAAAAAPVDSLARRSSNDFKSESMGAAGALSLTADAPAPAIAAAIDWQSARNAALRAAMARFPQYFSDTSGAHHNVVVVLRGDLSPLQVSDTAFESRAGRGNSAYRNEMGPESTGSEAVSITVQLMAPQ
jgi:hypothetical protein